VRCQGYVCPGQTFHFLGYPRSVSKQRISDVRAPCGAIRGKLVRSCPLVICRTQVRRTHFWETWNLLQSSISFDSSSREMSIRHIRQQSHKPHFRLTSLDDQPSSHVEGYVTRDARDNSKDRVGLGVSHPSANYFIRYPVPAFSRPDPLLCFGLGILSALNTPVFLRSREAYKMDRKMKGIIPTKFLLDSYLTKRIGQDGQGT
jgi:hypothetical protein